MEAHRLADESIGIPPRPAAVGVVHRHGRQLRVRLLLHFYQDGGIHCEVKLTGIMNTNGDEAREKSGFGVEVAPQLNAPFHQHIFAARLDFSVDGPRNSVYEVNTVTLPRSETNPHGNAFRAEATLLESESDAMRSVNSTSGRFWRIVNPEEK